MAKIDREQYFSAPQLKDRGWTRSLMKELLGKAKFLSGKQGMLPHWPKAQVLDAENSEEFIKRSKGIKPKNSDFKNTREAQRAAIHALKDAWDAAEKEYSLIWTLAAHYHRCVIYHLYPVIKGRVPTPTQVTGYLNQFMSMEKSPKSADIPSNLTHFVNACVWLGGNLNTPLAMNTLEKYPRCLYHAARQAIEDFSKNQQSANVEELINMEGFPYKQLLSRTISTIYSVWYVPQAIRTSLSVLIALNPKDEYPEARAMRRHFTIHIGGTNTGKTYAGFQRLIRAETGVYLAPLRLLALEAQETLLDWGVNCSLTTGEEEDRRAGDTHVAATAEKLDMKAYYDVAVIDECQMIADRERGYAWTRAILGVLAPEIHLCAAPEAKNILLWLIDSCGDTYDIEVHERKTPLVCMNHTIDYTHVQPGDALITFSKIGVLSVAEDLRQSGKEPAIIYGALPYSTRRKQMEGFLQGKMQYVVSTDAIGMGLNLPIRRIIFMDTTKFDGVERRDLKPEEIQQIAGRAGRYGMYDVGYVGATQSLSAIRTGLETVVPPIQHAIVGFSDLVLQVDFDLLEVLTEWNKMPTVDPYIKLDISRYIFIISKLRELDYHLPKEYELRAANIPFDETDESLMALFFDMLSKHESGQTVEQPGLPEEGSSTLPELELYCRKLDLYFSFTKAFDIQVDEDKLYDCREIVADEINEILLHNLRNNIRFCAKCGAALPLYQKGRLCDACWRKSRRPRPVGRRK